ncbi:MAG: alpha/beta hydrolase [Pyrinomonadaceae bacterium]
MNKPRYRSTSLCAVLGLLVLSCLAWLPPAVSADTSVIVSRIEVPVRLSDGNVYTVAGYLYIAPTNIRHRTLQLLVHGATYDHRYWDGPTINGIDYSYARNMARRGYVLFAIDQLGSGASSKPDGDFFNLAEAASALHQVAQGIRLIAPGGCDKLAYVGHSNGSLTAISAQATYGDADGLVTTGWDHPFHPVPIDPNDPAIQEAFSHPYVDLGGPLQPVREGLFYFAPGSASDPAAIAFDSANLANTMPRAQFLDLLGITIDIASRGPGGMTALTKSQGVRVPVLVQVGDHDVIAPSSAALAAPTERAFYPASPDFELQLLTNIGHGVNLHFAHEASWDGIDRWLQRVF